MLFLQRRPGASGAQHLFVSRLGTRLLIAKGLKHKEKRVRRAVRHLTASQGAAQVTAASPNGLPKNLRAGTILHDELERRGPLPLDQQDVRVGAFLNHPKLPVLDDSQSNLRPECQLVPAYGAFGRGW